MQATQMEWYEGLAKPAWTPPPKAIGTIWTILYPIIFVTFGYVTIQVLRGDMPWRVMMPIGINVAANLAFTSIEFGLRDLSLATADIFLVLITIIWSILAIWPYSPWAAFALTPYLIWVGTATFLQVAITLMNR